MRRKPEQSARRVIIALALVFESVPAVVRIRGRLLRKACGVGTHGMIVLPPLDQVHTLVIREDVECEGVVGSLRRQHGVSVEEVSVMIDDFSPPSVEVYIMLNRYGATLGSELEPGMCEIGAKPAA